MEPPLFVGQLGKLRAVGHVDQSASFVPNQAEKKVHNLDGILIIKIAGGFVGKYQSRAAQEGTANGHPLHFPSAEHLSRIAGPAR